MWATRHDPELLRILVASSNVRRRYDPGKHRPVNMEVSDVVRLARILRDYDDGGGLNELISLWGFVDDHVFLTKAGHVGLVYAVRGVDYEGLTHQQRQALVH